MNSFQVNAVILAIVLTALVLCSGCTQPAQEKTTLKVIAAGSLLSPFAEAEKEFEASHAGVDVEVEGHGSIQVIRQVTDLHRNADVVAVADESLIPDLMYREDEKTGRNFTDWYQPFATNEMVIVYTRKSLYSDEIGPGNWVEVLSRPDVRVGFSNPMLDAAGYRALMVFLLAGEEYGDPRIFDRVIGSHFDPPLDVSRSGTVSTVTLPEIMKPSDGKVVIRDGSIYLLSLLETGGIDYAIEYRSVAEGMGLDYILLPAPVNLGRDEYAENYRRANVVLGFQRFSSIGRERTGLPIVYALTIPSGAGHPGLAREFIDYVSRQAELGRPGWPAPLREAGNA
ncbi:molybdate/tungstate transport system substrate-binding protein [Methanolinea mesophila]|uniref:tungstate ABC transporter substrate-binding protein WtpA n=1 Tax=Methanolinea mesophila TaxID=547055 RepID=UPI0031581F7C|nr:molybdate/tungstate transport system substrate-binding protein [Methanolinea mesophila]